MYEIFVIFRSSYYEFILEVVPDPLHVLVPPKPYFSYRYEEKSGRNKTLHIVFMLDSSLSSKLFFLEVQ
jgi:hypothetical protein